MLNSSRTHVSSNDVGTLWTMRRDARTARCALIKGAGGWEVRVLVENKVLLSESCDCADEAFGLASRWQLQMRVDGWRKLVPSVEKPTALLTKPAGDGSSGSGVNSSSRSLDAGTSVTVEVAPEMIRQRRAKLIL